MFGGVDGTNYVSGSIRILETEEKSAFRIEKAERKKRGIKDKTLMEFINSDAERRLRVAKKKKNLIKRMERRRSRDIRSHSKNFLSYLPFPKIPTLAKIDDSSDSDSDNGSKRSKKSRKSREDSHYLRIGY